MNNSLERSLEPDNLSDAGNFGRSYNRASLDDLNNGSNAYSTVDYRRRYIGNGIDTSKSRANINFDNHQKNELLHSLQEKVKIRYKNPAEQKKALNRIELLKGYLNIETQPYHKRSDDNNRSKEFIDRIKAKMTQELLKFNKSRENSIEKSKVFKRLNDSLKLKADPIKAILYARDYFERNDNDNFIHIEEKVFLKLIIFS